MTDIQQKSLAVTTGIVALALIGSRFLFGRNPSLPLRRNADVNPGQVPVANNVILNSIFLVFRLGTTTDTRMLVIRDLGGTLISYDPRSQTADIRISPRHSLEELRKVIDEADNYPSVQYAGFDTIWQGY